MLRIWVMAYFLIGCTSGFKPPPPAYDRWKKSNVIKLEIKKALLECGYPTPSGVNAGSSNYEIARWNRCMKNSGFSKDEYFCEGLHDPPPACQPDAIIPVRNVERRLNSHYCTNYGKSTPECQPPGQEFTPQKLAPVEKPISDSDANHYFEQNRFREQTKQLQIDMQNNSNRQMKKMLRDTAPKSLR